MSTVPQSLAELAARFFAKVRIPDDLDACWQWTASGARGYGLFYDKRPGTYAHRWSYEYWNGPIPDGLQIDHLCRNKGCVNPRHLEAVTGRENTLRGTSFAAREAKVTRCPRGHAYDESNTYVVRRAGKRPKRQCRSCKAINQRAYKARRAA